MAQLDPAAVAGGRSRTAAAWLAVTLLGLITAVAVARFGLVTIGVNGEVPAYAFPADRVRLPGLGVAWRVAGGRPARLPWAVPLTKLRGLWSPSASN
ncbi:hypothetical protein BH24ACT3_BH24ACT3_06520 [soil metagenome]